MSTLPLQSKPHTWVDAGVGSPAIARPIPERDARALTRIADPRAVFALQSAGDAILRAFQEALQEFLGHRKRDGNLFAPRIVDSSVRLHRETRLPHYYMVIAHPNTLYHYTLDELTSEDLLTALTAAIGRQVFALNNLTGDYPAEFQRGIIYLVSLLKDTPAPVAPAPAVHARLPRVARLADALVERDNLRGKLLVPIGVSAEGAVWRALPAIKHARFVGVSSSGKTTTMHCALAALLTQNSPAQLRVALIDLKRNEFVFWNNAPHRWGEIARDVAAAEDLLAEIKTETDRRNDLLAAAMRRSIESYNMIAAQPLPYLLVVVDEARELVSQAGTRSRTNKLLQSISTGGRSGGVYFWAGTQYAGAAEGLSRVISENLKSFVFRVADAVSARVAGCPGAQNIPESTPGRMLTRLSDGAEPTLIQGFFMDDDELRRTGAVVAGTNTDASATEPFSDEVRALLVWARDENNGLLTAFDIQGRSKAGPRGARTLAEQLEREGWLYKDSQSQNRRRLTTQALAQLAHIEQSALVSVVA